MPRGRKRQDVPGEGGSPRAASTPAVARSRTLTFAPVDRGALWGRLRLNASQVAALSGATLRQVIHWADQGYLPHVEGDARTFSGVGLDTARLIIQARAAGLSVKRAAVLARQYLATEFVGAPKPAPPGPSALGSGLREIEEAARALREQVEPDGDGPDAAS